MRLGDVHTGITGHKKTKRLGRGHGTGQGKTAGRGHKGQGSRAGWSQLPIFQGGAMPLVRRVPKRGFHNRFADQIAIVNLDALERSFSAGEEVNLDTLRAKAVVKGRFDQIKILGKGKLTKKLKVVAHRFSKAAESSIKAAGGQTVVLPGKSHAGQTAAET